MVKPYVKSTIPAVEEQGDETPIRVLHVDDEAGFMKTTKQILEMQGPFEVESAPSVEEALEKMKKKTFDAVVCDHVMPGKDGLEFLKELRDSGNKIPFIMFTGKGREEVAIEALNLGADRYINKIGRPKTVYGELAHGVMEAVETKRALEAEELYKVLVENLQDAILFTDLSWKGVFINKAAEKLTGYTKEEMLGKSPREIILPKYWPLCDELNNKALTGQPVSYVEMEIRTKNGQTVPVETGGQIIIKNGETTGLLIIVRDIRERKAMDKKLRNSEERYRALLEETPIGISNIDFKGNLTYVNREFERITGFSREESLGKSWLNLASKHGAMSRENLRLAARLIMRRFVGKPDTFMKFQLKRRDGSLRWVESNANLIKKHGVPVGLQAVSRDVTEIIASEKSLKEAMKELEVFNEKLRVIGELTRHDIRNKLQAAHNSLFLTKQKLRHDPEALQHMDVIESSCKHVEEILEFAGAYERLGAEKLVCLDVEESLKEAISQFPDLHSVRVVKECHGLTVLADSMLRQLFFNLIDNSLKYGEKISQIRLFYEKAGKDKLKMIYEDNGVGIPKAEKEKIFNEGYGKGTGYGLYLIRKICEVYGWTIRETGKHGEGARFTITIPQTNESGEIAYQLN